jgi:hypothetical protein
VLATSEEEREREVLPEKPAPCLATPDLVMSRAEVKCRGGGGVNSGQDLLAGNGDISSTSMWRGMGHGARGGDRAWCNEAEWAWREMEHGAAQHRTGTSPQGGLGRRDGAVSRAKRNEELGISVVCRSVDGADRGERA